MTQSSRPLYVGLLSGIVAALILAFPLYGSLSQSYIAADRARVLAPDAGPVVLADVAIWPNPSPLDLTVYLLGAVVVAAAGFAAARGEAVALRRVRAGATAGSVAGAVAWLGVGAGAAGVVGHAPLWLNGARPVNAQFLPVLLSEAVIRSAWLVPLTLAVLIGVAAAAGGLGGLVQIRWLPGSVKAMRCISVATQLRATLSLLMVTLVTLIVAVGVLTLLEQRVSQAALDAGHRLSFPASGLTGLPTGGLLTLAAALSWRTWRLVPVNGMHRWHSPGVLAGAAVVLLQLGSLAMLILINPQGVLKPISVIGCITLTLSTAVGLPLAMRARRRSDLPPERAAVWQDWLDTLVLISLGGATIMMAGVVALGLSLVLGAIAFIDALSGPATGGAGAIPTVTGSIESMYGGSLVAVMVVLLLPLVSLPVFLTYDGLRFAYGRLRESWVWMIAGLSGLGTGVVVGGLVGGVLALCAGALFTLAGRPNSPSSSLAGSVITLAWLGAPAWFGLVGLIGGQGIALGLEPDRLWRWVRGAAASCALGILALWMNYNWGGESWLAPIILATAGGVLVFQWRALWGLYPWARWWPWVNLGCAVLAGIVGVGALFVGGGLPPKSFVGLALLLLVTPILYTGLTGAFLVRVGALNEGIRQQLAEWWSQASIRQKLLLLPGIFVLLSLLVSLIGYQVGSNATRVRLLQQQLDQDAARVKAAVGAQDEALGASVVELTDPRILRAVASPGDQAALRAAGELANELRVRYGLSQVIVSSGDAQPILSVAEPETIGAPEGWALIDTSRAEHRALLTCPSGDNVRLVSLPIFIDALSASGVDGSPPVDLTGQPLTEVIERRPLIIACAPLEGGSVFALLDPEYARTRIDEQARLQSGLSFRFAEQEGAPPASDSLATLGQTIFGQSLAIDLRLGVPVEATLTASTRQLSEVIAVGFRAMLIASLVTLAALVIFGRWLARGFTRSLIRLTDAARAVTAGDLSQQVPVTSQDEIGDLAGAFNTMVAGLREREAAVRQREAAEAASRSKSMFLANMSHELRTPLNAILGFTQLMLRDRSLSADQRESLQVIGRSGEHLLALINDVLEMSKIEAGRVELREERFDLLRLLEDLDEMFQVRAAEKGLQLLVEPGPEVPRFVRADKGKLRQVLINLIGNAVKFTGEGGVTVRVGLRGGVEGGSRPRLIWEIEDTGPGMAPEEVSAIFEAFVQASSGRHSQEGTGLGLAISRQFVTLMGGELTVRSQFGHGSVFGFNLPVEVVDAVDEVAVPVDRVVGLATGQQEFRILVVEDKWYNRHLLVKLLASLGFGVREAANGEEGVAVWHAWRPHLIFMDMRMPVMDGYEATRTIKGSAGGAETVIVALTASAFEEERSRVADAGCDDFIRKPFRNEQLFAALERHLGVRFVREEAGPEDSVRAAARAGGAVDLSGLPPDALAALRIAAEQADAEAVEAVLVPLADEYPELARAVADLVENFRFDIILSATEGRPMGAQP